MAYIKECVKLRKNLQSCVSGRHRILAMHKYELTGRESPEKTYVFYHAPTYQCSASVNMGSACHFECRRSNHTCQVMNAPIMGCNCARYVIAHIM